MTRAQRIGPAYPGGPDAILEYEHIGRDCDDGKHRACIGDAWNETTDQPAECGCSCHKEGTE